MRLYYRISNQSYEKPKLIGATKEMCFMNFLKAFASAIFKEGNETTIIADRCDRKTNKMLQETGLRIFYTDLGNAGSLKFALEHAMNGDDNDLVYFCEDDYLHLDRAPIYLEEGIKRADYVTLYDHPDKYTRFYDGGEVSKVIKTASTHWRYTASTCMTFGTKVKTLKEDIPIWDEFTSENHPHDHQIFQKLSKENRRRLAVCIPGIACHTDLTFSGAVSTITLDKWAIDLMISELEGQVVERLQGTSDLQSMLDQKVGWEKLVFLDAILKQLP